MPPNRPIGRINHRPIGRLTARPPTGLTSTDPVYRRARVQLQQEMKRAGNYIKGAIVARRLVLQRVRTLRQQ